MKKQILNLGKALNKAEQKEINGGGTCSAHIPCGHESCGGGENNYLFNVSQAEAIAFGGRWCCESCSTASWLQPEYMWQ
ncbi:hypothetical protein [Tenacibaculum haliotis]|uniref:hypothetical protein n=1 Tax=Tenacibaculum haliotis TaxID=1888914 RepID=UPI0021AF7353|nr:hypothetical protein [Tenacibaculum haliotis]MCT4699662.1 hypothetical protein [Tenacibaculum haliotis]